jgi:hypothetical protein
MTGCALPPVDQRYARVVAANAQGLDVVAFGRSSSGVPQPIGAPVVSVTPGTVRAFELRAADLGFRNPVLVEAMDVLPGARPLFFVYSGLAFAGRPAPGTVVRAGTPIGSIAEPERIDFLRARDRTAGTDPRNAYLHIETWTTATPTFTERRAITGSVWSLESGYYDPRQVFRALGIDLVGAPGTQVLAVRTGGPADPATCGAA